MLNNIFDNSIEAYEQVINESENIKVKEEKKKLSKNELENNQLTVKPLRTTDDQQTFGWSELIVALKPLTQE